MDKETLNIIISSSVHAKSKERIAQICEKNQRHTLRVITPEDFNAAHDPAEKTIAFLSADVLGNSSKTVISPEMQAFASYLDLQENLLFVQVPGAGVDRDIYKNWARQGATICNASGIASKAVAHSAIAGLLSMARKFPELLQAQARKEWISLRGDNAPRSLENNTALVVGMGAIGKEISLLCKALGMRTYGVSKSGTDRHSAFDLAAPLSRLDELLPQADWVILACPLTPETHELMDSQKFARLKPGVGVINVARGSVLVENDLLDAIQHKKVFAAYLDVFEVEPLPRPSPLWDNPSILISPHSAGDFFERNDRLIDLFVRNVERHLQGQALINATVV